MQLLSDSVRYRGHDPGFLSESKVLLVGEQARLAFFPEPVAFAADGQDIAVVQQPVQDGRGDDFISQELSSLAKALVRSQDDGAPLVAGRHQSE